MGQDEIVNLSGGGMERLRQLRCWELLSPALFNLRSVAVALLADRGMMDVLVPLIIR